ncbi:hypothetical protein VTN96DRAFT_5200 [Rasamsonia emersonii]|uniref:Cell wall mannoprotein 1 n=1 Tax=Rasamsonia emersonii (strain ATCC 16479 / CBS 393.64 / IMI 116815) TaxID=1408163 RepID=A0A0F4YQB0_RASE3|nr:Uncharacterized protein T310_6195 [Rasamsonia emersonii CBS 393.64]KKA19803.1 Uncharacterized protein T310_6195 [Rasamsonia emersonii CBS 393.64]
MLPNTVTALVLSFSLVAAGPIVKRSVLTDLTTIGNDLTTLQKDITGWDGSVLSAIPLLGDVTNVENAIKTAINDTDASAPFGASDSTSVTNEVLTLEPQITTTLNDLVQKEPQVAAIGYTSQVQSSLTTLKNLTDQLTSALESKATSSDASTIANATTSIDAAFSSAIAAF